MKKNLTIMLCIYCMGTVYSQNTTKTEAQQIAESFLEQYRSDYSIGELKLFHYDNSDLFWVVELQPTGYIFVSDSRKLRPVYSYSLLNSFEPETEEWQRILPIISSDIETRLANNVNDTHSEEWNHYLSTYKEDRLFEQWPPAGTTSTGGWLETNWTQQYPYNTMCPMDLQTGNRSVAGCPATAIAMVLNFHQKINNTRFDDNDDYYHAYGANQFWIDDDYLTYDFASFHDLNTHLDTLEINYNSQKPITNDQKAALTWASGIAARQVYSSSISGTFGLDQAFMAYQRFAFDSAKMVFDSDTSLYGRLADNMKMALPSHLALLNAAGQGHNVVVDGYNTDEYYHFNFGWGGSGNAWYTMPPTDIPYDLTIVDGAVIDINLEDIYVGHQRYVEPSPISLSPNPCGEHLSITNLPTCNDCSIKILSVDGNIIYERTIDNSCDHIHANLSQATPGLYVVLMYEGHRQIAVKKLLIVR